MGKLGKPVTQRQLRVGEMIKQALSMIFLKDEAKLPNVQTKGCLLYTSPSPRDRTRSRMPSSA